MKRSKLIIRFLEKHHAASVRNTLDELYSEWKKATSPPMKIDRYVRVQLNEMSDFILELDQYVWQGNFSEVGFFILVKCFNDRCSFEEREQFMRILLSDWKRNSSAQNKKNTLKTIELLIQGLRACNTI